MLRPSFRHREDRPHKWRGPPRVAVGRAAGELYTTGTGCQVYRVDVAGNRAEQFAMRTGCARPCAARPTSPSPAPTADILFAASLDNLVIHHFDGVGAHGLKLNDPHLPS